MYEEAGEPEPGGDWFLVDGQWVQEIGDPYEDPTLGIDPAQITSGTGVPIDGFATGPGLALLLAGDPGTLSDAALIDAITGHERLTGWAGAGQAEAIAELIARRTTTDPNEWPFAVEEITLALSCSRVAAGNKAQLGTDLVERLPATLSAWGAGRICAAWARVLSEGTRHLSPEDAAFVEDQLLPSAETLSPSRLKALVAALADSLDPRDIEDRHADAAEDRRVIRTPREDGMASLWALLPADQAATLWAAINTRAETHRDCADERTADQRRADALTDLARDYLTGTTPDASVPAAAGTDTGARTATSADEPTATSPAADLDASVGVVTNQGNGTAGRPGRGAAGSRPRVPAWAQVQLKVPADLLLGASTEPATLRGHGPIPTSMALRLAADAQWQRIVYHPLTGALLDVGTKQHDPPPALREFVLTRDQTCIWVNCSQPRVDLDHPIPYPDGPTADYNLDAKCRRHHRTKQHRHFTAVRNEDGSSTITTATGHTYHAPARDLRPPPLKPKPPKQTPEPEPDNEPPPF